MITGDTITKVDQKNIYQIYERWPDHFREASKITACLDHAPDFYKSIVFCGMGGSGAGNDILHDLIQAYGNIPSLVLKGERMPEIVSKQSLVIIASVSGNTEETLSMMDAATAKDAEVICISSGGKIKERADKDGRKCIVIPNLSAPRVSLPYLIMPSLKLISPFLNKSLPDTSSICANLSKVASTISIKVPDESNISKQVASFLETGLAFCFTSPFLFSVGTRFKNSLNENSKAHCLRSSILESSHNEIVPFTYGNDHVPPRVLFLKWAGDSDLVRSRFERVGRLFAKIKQPILEVNAFEKDLLNAILCSIYILDYSTIYLAISKGIDPSPTPAIDVLKKM